MKKYLLFIAVSTLATFSALAEKDAGSPSMIRSSVPLPIPGKMAWGKIERNSDLSISIFAPKVYRLGQWRSVSGESARGFCSLLNKKKEFYAHVDGKSQINLKRTYIVTLDAGGKVVGFDQEEPGSREILKWVICRKRTATEMREEAQIADSWQKFFEKQKKNRWW